VRNTPKSNFEKLQQVSNAWETLASNKSFGGMTFLEFQAATAPSTAARSLIDDLEDQLTQALAARDAADATSQTKIQLVVNGVLADPTEGPDSALYEAMGYTRKSERKSGLTRKKTGKVPPT
jgi:hypothetical protein